MWISYEVDARPADNQCTLRGVLLTAPIAFKLIRYSVVQGQDSRGLKKAMDARAQELSRNGATADEMMQELSRIGPNYKGSHVVAHVLYEPVGSESWSATYDLFVYDDAHMNAGGVLLWPYAHPPSTTNAPRKAVAPRERQPVWDDADGTQVAVPSALSPERVRMFVGAVKRCSGGVHRQVPALLI